MIENHQGVGALRRGLVAGMGAVLVLSTAAVAGATGRGADAATGAAGLSQSGDKGEKGSGKGKGPKGGGPAAVQDSPTVPNPVVSEPGEGVRGGAYNRSRVPLVNGYIEQEFFYEGLTRAANGTTALYKTRILMRRPNDPAAFNGSVVVDWTNVTIPDDTDVSWLAMEQTIMERGFVYVAVAAQRLAVETSPIALKQYDPVRYGSLSHPGDDYSFDIYSQASEALLDPLVMKDLRPLITRRLSVGASQSGGRLKTYINDFAEAANVFEGFMPQISGAAGVRRDLAPVLWLNSQSEIKPTTDVKPDSGLFRFWEMAGPAHAPHGYNQYQNSGYVFHETNGAVDIYDADEGTSWGYQKMPGECTVPNIFNPAYQYNAALVALDDWVTSGVAPAVRERADRSGGKLNFDKLGNLLGGIRSPLLEVPIAKYYAGSTPPGSGACGAAGPAPLVGSTQLMSAEELTARYGTSSAFAGQFDAAIDAAVARGEVLPEGARDMRGRLPQVTAWVAAALGE